MLRVLLVSANRTHFPEPVFPLGITYVASALIREGASVRIFDAGLHLFPLRALSGEIMSFRPQAIGLSLRNIDNATYPCTEYYVPEYLRVVRAIRARSNAPIFLGGSAFSIFPKELMALLCADAGAGGDGEDVIIRLCRGERGSFLSAELPDLGVVEFPRTIDSLFPSFRRYRTIGIQSARGCPHRCIYCTYPILEGSRVRTRLADAVVDEIDFLYRKHGRRDFFFVNSSFNANETHMAGICEALIRKALPVRFSCYLEPKMSDRSLFRLLAEAGCIAVDFGTDSCSETVLRALGKGFTVEDIKNASEGCKRAGIDFCHSLLFGGPGETAMTVKETVRNMDSIRPKAAVAMTGIRVYPKTEIEAIARKEGILSSGDSLLWPRFYFPTGYAGPILAEVIGASAARRNWFLPGRQFWSAAIGPYLLRLLHRKGPLWRTFRDGEVSQ